MSTDFRNEPIAVVGVSAIFPGSVDATGFWRDILEGTDLVRDIPESHWLIDDYYDPDPTARDKTYAHRGAFLEDVTFDPLEWGVPPSIVPATDTTQLLALIVAKMVLRDALGSQFADADLSNTACILGVTSAQELLGTMVNRLQRPVWVKAMRELGYAEDEVQNVADRIGDQYVPWQESTFPGLLGNVVAGRIANRLDLGGTNCVTDAACASSFSALSMAVNELRLGQSDLVLTGGADTMNDIFMYMCFSKTPALSKSGECAPFNHTADGTLLGEGLGMVALKRLSDAEAAGDRVYAVITGVGSSSDGRSKSVYAPVPTGQAKALRRAYAAAGYGPETVELVEAHGTGTKAGDAAEFSGLELAFREAEADANQWCALGTVKSQIGHTKAAAGAAGLFKVVMALHHKVLPPTIKIDQPNPNLNIEASPFYLNTQSRPWVRGSAHKRRGSVSSFGFGGSNFHIALEEYTGANRAWRRRTSPTELVLVAEADAAAAAAKAIELAQHARAHDDLPFLARSTQTAAAASSPARIAVVAETAAQAADKLEQAAKHLQSNADKPLVTPTGIYVEVGSQLGDVGFLFPGQGSQYLNMGAGLAMGFDAAMTPWDVAADAIEGRLHDVVFPQSAFDDASRSAQQAALTRTEWAQPAIGVTSLSQLALLQQLGLKPSAMGGHSYGEITALAAAGAFDAATMIRIARKRGQLMADAAASTDGAMTAVPRHIDEVSAIADTVDGVVVANHNGPTQVVLSGTVAGIEAVEAKLRAADIEPKRLSVATAFHSPVVSPSSDPFAAFLADIQVTTTTIPVWSNQHAAPYAADADAIRTGLAEQIAHPVRFVEQIEGMYAAGVRTFVEVGPGRVLSNLVGDILGDRAHRAVNLDRKRKHGLTSLHHGLARLFVGGANLALSTLWEAYAPIPDPATAPQPKLRLAINGSNYDKPYPPKGGTAALPKPNPVRVGAAAAGDRVEIKEVVREVVKEVEVIKEVPVHVPVPTAATATAPQGAPMSRPDNRADDQWMSTFQEAQRSTAEAHSAWQNAMNQSHIAYLNAVQQSYSTLAGMFGAQGVPAPQMAASLPAVPAFPTAAPAPQAAWTPPAPPTSGAPAVQSLAASELGDTPAWSPTPAPASESSILVQNGFDVVPEALRPGAPTPVSPPAPVAAPVAAAPSVDLNALMLEVVADKTGYPSEMLGLEMELESDLGVDSIKRVEILSAMRERAPQLPEVDAGEMAALVTLGQIVDYMAAKLPTGTNRPGPVPSSATPSIDLNALMLEVVADKTGYPSEMLGLEMELESDLGVDSIKRVEILSAMRERAPQLPEVDAGEMAALVTLGQIVDYMAAKLPAASTPVSTVSATVSPAAAAPTIDLNALMLDVVADKTGYPADMLGMEMELESDLGVDSIKRVEILSAMRERAPELPEVDAGEMAALVTLGQIVDYMQARLPAGSNPVSPVSPVSSTAAPIDLEGLMLDVVADKTGYPADMLGMEMELEPDLGVDSIKRVEILSAMRERAPELPEVDAGEMAALVTLGQIVDYMRARSPQPTPGASAPTPAATPAIDLEGLMLDVVADKTGYPADMLGMEMELESDLGVDSIKRVEILSAMRERAPELPEVDAGEMAALVTLGQIVDYMRARGPQAGTGRAAPVAVTAAASTPALGRFATEAVAAAAAGLAQPHLEGTVAILGAKSVGRSLAKALKDAGVRATQVDQVPDDATAVIVLDGLVEGSRDDMLQANKAAFSAAKAVATRFAADGGLFVTVQDTGGDFGLSGSDRAWVGGLAGLVKTASQEWPAATVKAIDVERGGRGPKAIAIAIANELLSGGAEVEVGLKADGARITLRSIERSTDGGDPVLGAGDVVVASGGARGVTAATLIALAKATGASFALLGRTTLQDEPASVATANTDAQLKSALLTAAKASGTLPTPAALGKQVKQILANREIRGTLSAIEAAGGKARYLSVDVNAASTVTTALDSVRSDWGPITALVHGAGVLADKLIAEKTVEQFNFVFDTKVNGLTALLAATQSDPLKWVVMFSSVAARCGNQGQCDYAMANEVLNKVACQLAHARDIKASSMGWGPWEGGMVTPALKARFESLGVPLIPLSAGAQMLVDECGDRSGTVEVVLGGEPRPEPLAAEATPRNVRLSVRAAKGSHPYLKDHAIAGVPVVPVVLAVEWMARAARALRPDLHLAQVKDVKVLRGIKLSGFEGQGDWLTVEATELSNGAGAELAVEVRSTEGAVHYRATAVMTVQQTLANGTRPADVALEPWGDDAIYDGHVLFHGGDFQVIRDLTGVGTDGIQATLSTTAQKGWSDENWHTDPASLDGGLQLALLWSKKALGGASLPMSLGALHAYTDGPVDGPLQATLRGTVASRERAVSDIVFTDPSGAVVAELRGVETILRPGEA